MAALGRPAADAVAADLADGGGQLEVVAEAGDPQQVAVGGLGGGGQGPHLVDPGLLGAALILGEAGVHHRRGQVVQVPGGPVGLEVVVADHLALLGQAQAAVHGVGRLGQDGAVGGAAAPADRAAPAVEEAQAHAMAAGAVQQGLLRLV
jgi:hypothetical protein